MLLSKVEGMDVKINLGLEYEGGTLKLSPLECGCFVKDIAIILDGGLSWLYQGYVSLYLIVGSFVKKGILFVLP